MAETADRVVVELLADVDQADVKIRQYRQSFDGSMKQVEASADRMEKAVERSANGAGSALLKIEQGARQASAGAGRLGPILTTVANAANDAAGGLGGAAAEGATLGSAFGPIGTAAGTAAGILASVLIPSLFDTGEAADDAKGKVDDLAKAIHSMADLGPVVRDMLEKQGELHALETKIANLRLTGNRAGALAAMPLENDARVLRDQIQSAQNRIDFESKRLSAAIDAKGAGVAKDGSTKTKAKQVDDDAQLAIKSVGTLAQELGKLSLPDLLKANQVGSYSDITGVSDPMSALRKMIDEGYTDSSGAQHVGENAKNALSAANTAASNDYYAKMDDRVKTVADLYENAMLGANGNIGDTLKHALIKSIATALATAQFGSAGSQGGGFFSNVLSGFTSALGFASGGGGIIGGRPGVDQNLLQINGRPLARVSRGELLTVAPARAARRQAGTTVLQTIEVDARGAVMNDEFASLILARANQDAARITAQGLKAGDSAMPGRLQRFQSLGT